MSRTIGLALAVSAVGWIALAVGWWVDSDRAFFAYLAAYAFVVSTAIGALIFLMIGHVSQATWFVVFRRSTESLVATLPFLALLFVPILAGLPKLYAWARPLGSLREEDQEAVLAKEAWLSTPFFVARTIVYFATFAVIGLALRRWSLRQDESASPVWTRRLRALSGGGLPVISFATTFASIDWFMSLQPSWYSTMFGFYVFAAGTSAAVALVAILAVSARDGRLATTLTSDHTHAIGRVLFAFVILWGYIAFGQFLIIWIGDIPEESRFYGLRISGGWTGVVYVLILGRLVLPFFALLSRRLKRRPEHLAWVAGWVVCMHFVDCYWLTLPVYNRSTIRPSWMDLGALLAVGGLAVVVVLQAMRRAPALPTLAPELSAGLHYEAAR